MRKKRKERKEEKNKRTLTISREEMARNVANELTDLAGSALADASIALDSTEFRTANALMLKAQVHATLAVQAELRVLNERLTRPIPYTGPM